MVGVNTEEMNVPQEFFAAVAGLDSKSMYSEEHDKFIVWCKDQRNLSWRNIAVAFDRMFNEKRSMSAVRSRYRAIKGIKDAE